MQSKKFKMTGETICVGSIILHRIIALRNFDDVKIGQKGGFIEQEKNLSHGGNSWVYKDACVCDDAEIFDNAKISGHTCIFDKARICGNAKIYDNMLIGGNTLIC